MALQYSPKIVQDSLVMCLDASQNKSYPTDLPVKNGLALWLDAADDSTFSYSSGTTVTQWRDKSGLNNHCTPLTAGPTRSSVLNSRKVLAFTTGQSIGSLSFTMETSANTVFVVSRLTGTTNARVLTAYYNNWLLGHWGGLVNPYYAEGWVYYPPNAADTVWRIHMGDWGGPSNDLAATYSNGTVLTSGSTVAAAGPKGLGINFQGGEPSTCEAAEIIVFNRLLSATERKQVHTYLGQKWGISNTDRSIIDLSGNNNHGLLGNGTTADMPLFDVYNKGTLNFDGTNDAVIITNNFLPADSSFSISTWVKIKVVRTSALIDSMNDSAAYDGFALWITSGGKFIFYILKNTVTSITSTQSYSTDTWYNVVAIYNQSTIAIYINGVLDVSSSYSSGFDVGTGNIGIGRRGANTNDPTSCNISQVSFYRKGLSAVEVAQNYEAQKSKFANTIVQQGLVLNLDAGNPYSYAGAGSAWYDVSGNNLIFNSQGATQTPFTTIGGSPCFDFNGSGYWECGTNFNLVDLGGDCTIIMWFYCETTAGRTTIFEKAGTSYASYEQEIAVTWEVANDFSYYSRYSPAYDYASTAASTVNAWNMVGIKMSTGKTAAARTGFYSKNGSAWQSSYTSRSNVALVAAGAIRVGSGYAGTVTNGYISSVLCYNRMLTDAEILQNYNATKGRFGL